MDTRQIQEMLDNVRSTLLSRRDVDGMWRGALSSSAISTSVSVFALHLIDKDKYKKAIVEGVNWLHSTMEKDGSWGDSVESPSNLTATLLTYTSLYALGEAPDKSRDYLAEKFGGYDDEHITQGVLDYYGKDLTFSVPILSMCALSGVISSWKRIPPFPFELAVLPQRFFRFLNLPVVSYAIPALIAIGILQLRMKHSTKSIVSRLRAPFVKKTLEKLITLQPEDGGFLEAAPLTAFVGMCLSAAGYNTHPVTQRAAQFLVDTQRSDGAWPIDTDLAGWVTSLTAHALGDDLEDAQHLADIIRQNATRSKHTFTGAPAGGWGWSNLSGSVPDGDDTSGALVALHTLMHGSYTEEVGNGLTWLMKLQNRDGGMPTFCKGWGKLPFDRSSPDISAHAVLAMGLWIPVLPTALQKKVQHSYNRLIKWLESHKSDTGAWVPLWFGDQDSNNEKSPVYGTATLMDYLLRLDNVQANILAKSGADFLLSCQNDDGGWGGHHNVRSKVTLTAKSLTALCRMACQDRLWKQKGICEWTELSEDVLTEIHKAIEKGINFLYERYLQGTLYEREPIGLYFARLWYSEELYNMCYLMVALKNMIRYEKQD